MRGRINIPIVLLIWVIIGVLIAVNKNYDNFDVPGRDDIDMIGRFVLAVVLWPVLAIGGGVDMHF
jgi:uncharacterized membrane protein YeiH